MPRYRGYQRCSSIDYADGHNIFFVTACVQPRRPVFVSPAWNQVVVDEVRHLHEECFWGVYLYCLMPDHLHLVVNPGPTGLSESMRRLKGRTTALWRTMGDGSPLWQPGFFDHRLRADESYTDKCRYVMMNPVRAGLAERPEDYPWLGSLVTFTGNRR